MDFQGCLCLRKSALLIETHTLPSFANHRALYRTRVAKGKEHRAEVGVERWGLRADIGECELAVDDVNTKSTAPTERTPSRGSGSNGHPVVARMIGGGLE